MSPADRIPFNDLSRMDAGLKSEVSAAIQRVVDSGWYVLGPEHDAFASELGGYLGASEVVLLGNGTDALEIALAAVGVSVGDTVMTVANAGAYSTIAIRQLDATPVYCDVSPETLLMTPELFAAALDATDVTPRAVVVTHLYGGMARVDEIVDLAHARGIAVVEDCAQSLGARLHGKQSGTFGDIATTSFYPTKNLGALGDGGAIFTNDAALGDLSRRMRQYGWASKYSIEYDRGRNSRLDEMQAAVLRVKLPHLDDWNSRRREIHARYRAASAAAPVVGAADESFIAHLAIVVSDDRDAARAVLADAGVSTDVHYPIPDHHQKFPTRKPAPVSLPVTERAAGQVLSVPMFPELTDAEVERVSAALAELAG